VLVPPADRDQWLSSPNPSALLVPWAGEPLETRPVSARVNSVRNDAPDLLECV
jgi:putative SOS response-associated peptidase YedK